MTTAMFLIKFYDYLAHNKIIKEEYIGKGITWSSNFIKGGMVISPPESPSESTGRVCLKCKRELEEDEGRFGICWECYEY